MILAILEFTLLFVAVVCLGAALIRYDERPRKDTPPPLPPECAKYFDPLFSQETLDELERDRWQD